MRVVQTPLTMIGCIVLGIASAAGQGPPSAAGAPSRPATINVPPPVQALRQLVVRYDDRKIASWPQRQVDGRPCRVSGVLSVPPGHEINLHRVTVVHNGRGTVELSLVHAATDSLVSAISKKHLRSRFRPVASGREVLIASPYKRERYSWLLLRTRGKAKVFGIRHICWRGKGTVYGHGAGSFVFGGAALGYRLMPPRDYDPKRAYPLVVSISGSGGVGSDNLRSMEMVILARHLFTRYYRDKGLECFSLVPQIPRSVDIPPPYWPKGVKGRPTPVYRPDWPTVNEGGWYVQASLGLIRSLIADRRFNIDPDRVYLTGFSYGGKACWEFLKADRGIFAGAMCGAGWPIGRVFTDPAGRTLDRLKLEVQRYRHVPVYVLAGEKDRMRFGSRAVHKEILAQGGKSTYVEFPATNHVGTAGKAWGNRKHIAWLFARNRRSNPAPGKDPFPGGAYPDRP